jgi:hypothetical protein
LAIGPIGEHPSLDHLGPEPKVIPIVLSPHARPAAAVAGGHQD